MKFVCFSIIAIEFNGRETLSYGKTSCKSHGWLFWTYFCFDPFYLLYALIICFSSVLSGNTTLLRIVRPRTHFQFDMGNYDITPFTLVESNLCNFFNCTRYVLSSFKNCDISFQMVMHLVHWKSLNMCIILFSILFNYHVIRDQVVLFTLEPKNSPSP